MANSSEKPLPPGSFGWPVIGETMSYVKNTHRFFESRFEEHGPVFKTRLIFGKIVCFVGPEAFTFFVNQESFVRNGAGPSHVPDLLNYHSLPLIDPPEHSQMRELVLQAFSADALETYAGIVEAATQPFLTDWEHMRDFTWLSEFKKLSATICDALFTNTEPRKDAAEFSKMLDTFLAGLTSLPIPFPWSARSRAMRSRDNLLAIIDDAITRHGRNEYDDMLTRFLNARGENEAKLTNEQLRSQLLHNFFAAYGGIFRVLTLLCLSMAQNPELMDKARAEVLQHAQSGPISIATIAHLVYLDQFTMEVRRHNRIFASTFPGRVTRSFEYQGYRIPDGWKAMGGIYTTMQDRETFANPHQFDPDRFGHGREEQSKQSDGYIPQGGGPMDGHRCPGEDLTTILMKVVAVLLLRDYKWELPQQNVEMDTEANPMPQDGLKVRFQRLG